MLKTLQIAQRFPGSSQADRVFLNNAASFAEANPDDATANDIKATLDDLLGPESKSEVA